MRDFLVGKTGHGVKSTLGIEMKNIKEGRKTQQHLFNAANEKATKIFAAKRR